MTVQVDVAGGAATCNGSVKDTEQGQSRVGTITGPGLIAIEFDTDFAGKPVYRITVACPTPAWPPGPNGEPATPSEPAELGHEEQNSYDNPAPGGVGMTLKGSYSQPSSDPLNGITGQTLVGWEFCVTARYQPVLDSAGNPTGRRQCV